jgi:predicted ATP-grasp superfamily ATP-dependent carboligase
MQVCRRDGQQPYAIIVGLESIQGLQSARILARRNVPVIGIASNGRHHCSRTRACKEIFFADTGTEEFIQTLETLGPKLTQKAVLFPCYDESVLLVSRFRQRLEQWYHVVLPSPEIAEMLMDKISFYTFAQAEGLPIPRSFFLYCRSDAEHAAGQLMYPCIMKPASRPATWTRHTKLKALKASNAAELLAIYDHYSRWVNSLIAQEWIEGNDANLYTCNCYFGAAGEPLVTFVSRKLRQWPPGTGQACLSVEDRDDTVALETARLYRSVPYRGLGYLEMKRDERTGRYFIIEANVGRPTGRSAMAESGGVELLYTMYCDALGWPLPANRAQKYTGVKWIYLLRDIQSALYYRRHGLLTFREWWASVQGRKTDALLSWRDPGPFLIAVARAFPTYLSRRERGKEDYPLSQIQTRED